METQGTVTIPVLVKPKRLLYVADDPATHKQLLTVYNPYDTPLTYEITCTVPRQFSVQGPTGRLKAVSSTDIIIALRQRQNETLRPLAKFKVQICGEGSPVSGSTTIEAECVLPGHSVLQQSPMVASQHMHTVTTSTTQVGSSLKSQGDSEGSKEKKGLERGGGGETRWQVTLFVGGLVVVCSAVLLAPVRRVDTPGLCLPFLPEVTSTHQLAAAMILGMVTMSVLHSMGM